MHTTITAPQQTQDDTTNMINTSMSHMSMTNMSMINDAPFDRGSTAECRRERWGMDRHYEPEK